RTIVAALTDTRTAIADLDSRLDHILLGGWAYGAISRDSDERRRALAARLGSRAPPAGRPRLGIRKPPAVSLASSSACGTEPERPRRGRPSPGFTTPFRVLIHMLTAGRQSVRGHVDAGACAVRGVRDAPAAHLRLLEESECAELRWSPSWSWHCSPPPLRHRR